MKLASKTGEAVDALKIARDVRVLESLGWFDSVSIELEEMTVLLASAAGAERAGDHGAGFSLAQQAPLLRLLFRVEERPYLAKLEYRGGQLLTRDKIREVFAEKRINLKLAGPCNRTDLWRASRAMEGALAELGHPLARVRVRLMDVPTAAVRAMFVIEEGPRVQVATVQFKGNEVFEEAVLQKHFKEIAPAALLAGWRGKTVYTHERLERDLDRIRKFYRDRGYAEAQTGEPHVEFAERRVHRWWPWPGNTTKQVINVQIPVREGTQYRFDGAAVEGASAAVQERVAPLLANWNARATYSEAEILRIKKELADAENAARLRTTGPKVEVEATSQVNRDTHAIRVQFRVHEAEPIVVRRIEFTGHKRFSDRYYRRRILLKEGEPFDTDKLQRGLDQLARGGFVRPATRDDVKVKFDEAARAADVTIHVDEIGQQRISLTGGGIGLGSSLGIAYNIFNLLGGEEMLTSRVEGGPQSVQILLGLAKDGLFGTRASLGVNLFRNVIQPRLQGRGRLFNSRSSGVSAAWSLTLTAQDTLGVNYEFSATSTRVPLQFPVLLPGVDLREVRSSSTRSGVELSWTRESPARHVDASAGVAGAWFGGSEQSVRTSVTAARLFTDPLSGRRNAWAFRGHLSGTSSFGGAALPFSARSFAGEEFIRGFRQGELGPVVVTQREESGGATVYGTAVAGANALVAVNGEYRVPIESHTEVAAFLDTGIAWLVPAWLGGTRPEISPGTNGIIRGSAGVEARLRLPVINETLRIHYAVNPWRLAQSILLPNGARSRPADRRAAWGWALGALF